MSEQLPVWITELRAGQQLLAELRARGLELRLVDGEPRCGPVELLDRTDLAFLTRHRTEIILALRWELPT